MNMIDRNKRLSLLHVNVKYTLHKDAINYIDIPIPNNDLDT